MSNLAYQTNIEEQPTPRRWTREEYYRMGDIGLIRPEHHTELIEGEIVYKMSPQQTPHAVAIRLLQRALTAAFGSAYDLSMQLPLAINDETELEPDAFVAQGSARRFIDSHPTPKDVVLVVEVSDSSLAFDRGRKARLYAKGGVSEYWIVNLVDRRVEVMTAPVEDLGYRTITLYREDETIPAPILGAQPIAVRDLLP